MKASIALITLLAGAAIAMVTPDPKAITKRQTTLGGECPSGDCCGPQSCPNGFSCQGFTSGSCQVPCKTEDGSPSTCNGFQCQCVAVQGFGPDS